MGSLLPFSILQIMGRKLPYSILQIMGSLIHFLILQIMGSLLPFSILQIMGSLLPFAIQQIMGSLLPFSIIQIIYQALQLYKLMKVCVFDMGKAVTFVQTIKRLYNLQAQNVLTIMKPKSAMPNHKNQENNKLTKYIIDEISIKCY